MLKIIWIVVPKNTIAISSARLISENLILLRMDNIYLPPHFVLLVLYIIIVQMSENDELQA
jgi:hypothetical protein